MCIFGYPGPPFSKADQECSPVLLMHRELIRLYKPGLYWHVHMYLDWTLTFHWKPEYLAICSAMGFLIVLTPSPNSNWLINLFQLPIPRFSCDLDTPFHFCSNMNCSYVMPLQAFFSVAWSIPPSPKVLDMYSMTNWCLRLQCLIPFLLLPSSCPITFHGSIWVFLFLFAISIADILSHLPHYLHHLLHAKLSLPLFDTPLLYVSSCDT